MKEFFSLLILRWKIKWKFVLEERKIRQRYYLDRKFKRVDRALLNKYFLLNPYRMCRKRGSVYGETFLTSLEKIARECELEESDRILELGSGRGRTVFFLSSLLGCEVRGVEWVSGFVKKAQRIKEKFIWDKVGFTCADLTQCDFSWASAVYVYGTCLSDKEIAKLLHSSKKLASKSKIITVSYSLLEYPGSEHLKLEKSFTVPFPWGEGEIFYHMRK